MQKLGVVDGDEKETEDTRKKVAEEASPLDRLITKMPPKQQPTTKPKREDKD